MAWQIATSRFFNPENRASLVPVQSPKNLKSLLTEWPCFAASAAFSELPVGSLNLIVVLSLLDDWRELELALVIDDERALHEGLDQDAFVSARRRLSSSPSVDGSTLRLRSMASTHRSNSPSATSFATLNFGAHCFVISPSNTSGTSA
jgi:hypothetical protein